MWGDLAQVMAQGLRGKRAGEAQRYERDQDLLATVDAQNQRAREQERYKASQERLAVQDARTARLDQQQELMSALQREMLQRNLATPERTPAQDYRARLGVEQELGVGNFAPQRPQQYAPVSLERFTGADGIEMTFNPRTGEARPASGPDGQPVRGPIRAQGQPTEGERKAAAFYASGKHGYDLLEEVLRVDPRPGLGAQMAAGVPFGVGNVVTSNQMRQTRQAALMLSDAWLRYTSGAAVPEKEVERFAESFIPRAGDDDQTLASKAASRKTIIDALRDGAGRALPPQGTPQQGPTAPPAAPGFSPLVDMARGAGYKIPYPENPYR